MKRQLTATVGAMLLGATVVTNAQEAVSSADLMKVIEKQNQQLEQLLNRVKDLENRQQDTSLLKKVILETNEALADTNKKLEKADGKLTLGSGIDGLKISGDARFRYEARDQNFNGVNSADNEDRARYRTRLRLGLLWTNKSENWDIGVGLASGGSDGRSTNQTWNEGDVFATNDIRLDYAYGKFKGLVYETPWSLTMGQQMNPFLQSYILWDDDLRPTGLTLQYGNPKSGPFVTAGAYDVLWGPNLNTPKTNEDADKYMYMIQAGYAHSTDDVNATLALAFRHLDNGSGVTAASMPNAYKTSPGLYGNDELGFDIIDVYGDCSFAAAGLKVRPYGQAAMNLSADGIKSQQNLPAGETPDQHDLAWILGLDLAKGKWKLGYSYAYIGADAVFGPMKDSDFGETAGLMDTDVMGHKFGLTYSVTKNFSLGLTAMMLSRIEGGSENVVAKGEADDTTLYQLDGVFKF